MKKAIILVLMSCGSAAVFAQIKSGATLLGGNLSMNTSKTSNNSQSESKGHSFYVQVSAGYAFKANTVAGLIVGLIDAKSEATNSETITNKGFTGGLFYRAYRPISNKWYWFLQGNALYSNNKNTTDDLGTINDRTVKSNAVSLGVTPGISYQLTKRLQAELAINDLANLQFQQSKTLDAGNNELSKLNTVGFGTGFTSNGILGNISLGFRLTL